MSRRITSTLKKRRAVLNARYHARLALKQIEKASKHVESDAHEDLVIAVRALRAIASNSGSDPRSAGVARGALNRMRLGGSS